MLNETTMFWLYFVVIFGLVGGIMFIFLKDSFPKGEKKKKMEMNKITGILISSLVFGFIVSIMIKTIRGSQMDFLSLYTITTTITFLIILALIKRKEKREKK